MDFVDKYVIIFSNGKTLLRFILFTGLLILLFGIGTVLIPNDIFIRMIPENPFDYALFISTSVLFGAFLAVGHYPIKKKNDCSVTALGGTFAGFLGFGCSICNQLLVLALGVTGVLTLFEPIRPFIGVLGVAIISYALVRQIQRIDLAVPKSVSSVPQ